VPLVAECGPWNQTLFNISWSFQYDFYEFVTDEYVTASGSMDFNGRIFSRIPGLQQLDLRELVGFQASLWNYMTNIAINRSNIDYRAKDIYYEYSVGIGNIFIRIDALVLEVITIRF
jgi:hypothetical protein